MINNLEDAVREFYFYQKGTAGGFQTALFDLFQKADFDNKLKLGIAFPHQLQALELWTQSAENGNALFRKYGLLKESESV